MRTGRHLDDYRRAFRRYNRVRQVAGVIILAEAMILAVGAIGGRMTRQYPLD